MKEIYFTGENLEVQSRDLFQQAVEISRQKVLEFQPLKSALLVLDMQSYFLDASSHAYVPSSQAIVNGISQLIKAYSDHQLPIFFSQHINTPENAGMMSVWWKDLITPDHPHHRIIPEIDTSVGTIIKKNQYDAFHQTPLEEMLQTNGVTQVVISGVMTHLCCETTARSAFMRGYQVFFLVDGTATYNLAYHRASLINLSHGFASLVFVKDILAAIQGVHEDR
jgi:bifunctional isochorismate lyase/aryl carrier protein